MILKLLAVLICVCIVFAAYIHFTERGKRADNFRAHWGGSDGRPIREPMARWKI